jgi:ribulose-phosphate 3-epimerase
MENIKLAASLICAHPLRLEEDFIALKDAEIDLIHFDVMDGDFVPRYGLYPEILSKLKKDNDCPKVDVHMMVSNPEDYIQVFADAGADYYNFHIEACNHTHRVIKKIVASGMKAGVALNPDTPLSSLDWIIEDIEMVVLMTINPGIVGHKFIPLMLEKIKDLRALANLRNPSLIIELDGGVTPETIPLMIKSGADALVCGNGTIFRPHEDSIANKVDYIKGIINEY